MISSAADVANGLKAQLLDYNSKYTLIVKENKRLEKRNAEIISTIKKSAEEYSELQLQLNEIREKTDRATGDRLKYEQQNRELEEDIANAKNTLKELQAMFRSIQDSTDGLKKKHNGKDEEFNGLLAQNKKLKGNVVELQWKLKDAENSLQLLITSKDEAIRKVQAQVSDANEMFLNTKEEIARLRHEKNRKERELEEWKNRSKERIDQLHFQFDKKVEQYLDDAMRSKLSSIDYSSDGKGLLT